MENFIPADGKSIEFIRALQFAHPVPETIPTKIVDAAIWKTSDTIVAVIGGIAIVIAVLGVVHEIVEYIQILKKRKELEKNDAPQQITSSSIQ